MTSIRHYVNILESAMNNEIYIEHDHGSAEGYFTDTNTEQFKNWFEHRHNITDHELIDKLKNKLESVVFLNNINVDDGERGNGYGTEILEDFISEAASKYPDAIILLADTEEGQEDGFDLVKFYEGYDFNVVKRLADGVLMIYTP